MAEHQKKIADVEEKKSSIFDIQGYSVHDGPGMRTTIFFNGCNLSCIWCANPEGIYHQPIMMYRQSRCVKCLNCVKTCPDQITLSEERNTLIFNRKSCDHCTSFACVSSCFHDALIISGKMMNIEEIMRIIKRDSQFWGEKGGVTFCGGEPLLQKENLLKIVEQCHLMGIHTCIETNGNIDEKDFQEIIPKIDWVFVDIKHMNPLAHKKFTGDGNELILKNIEWLGKSDYSGFVVVRIPLIPDINDSEENISASARFVKKCDLEVINILSYHSLGESKYEQLGKQYLLKEKQPPSLESLQKTKTLIEKEGIVCYIGYKTPF